MGKRRTNLAAALGGTAWALVLELGMMVGPPMAPMTGPFGVLYAWPQMFLVTLVAHIFFGIALGLLVQHFLSDEDRGSLMPFLRGPSLSSQSS